MSPVYEVIYYRLHLSLTGKTEFTLHQRPKRIEWKLLFISYADSCAGTTLFSPNNLLNSTCKSLNLSSFEPLLPVARILPQPLCWNDKVAGQYLSILLDLYAERNAKLMGMQKRNELDFPVQREGSCQGRQSPRAAEENFMVNGDAYCAALI